MISRTAASDAALRMRRRNRDVTRPVMVGSIKMSTFTVTSVRAGRPGGELATWWTDFWWIQRR